MDLTHHHLDSLTDDSWIKEYISKMGEAALYEYKNKVYKFLYNLKVGESISIEKWVETENYDLFIKIACCFMSEQKGSYYFYNNHTTIKHVFDAQEMEKTLAVLNRKRRESIDAANCETSECNRV